MLVLGIAAEGVSLGRALLNKVVNRVVRRGVKGGTVEHLELLVVLLLHPVVLGERSDALRTGLTPPISVNIRLLVVDGANFMQIKSRV